MTPLENLQALKIHYDVVKDRFEILLRIIEARKDDKEFIESIKNQAKFYGKLQEDLAFVILDIQTDIDPGFLIKDSKIFVKPKPAQTPEKTIYVNHDIPTHQYDSMTGLLTKIMTTPAQTQENSFKPF